MHCRGSDEQTTACDHRIQCGVSIFFTSNRPTDTHWAIQTFYSLHLWIQKWEPKIFENGKRYGVNCLSLTDEKYVINYYYFVKNVGRRPSQYQLHPLFHCTPYLIHVNCKWITIVQIPNPIQTKLPNHFVSAHKIQFQVILNMFQKKTEKETKCNRIIKSKWQLRQNWVTAHRRCPPVEQ